LDTIQNIEQDFIPFPHSDELPEMNIWDSEDDQHHNQRPIPVTKKTMAIHVFVWAR
jgi:hypothetical protein